MPQRLVPEARLIFSAATGDLENHQATAEESKENGEAFGSKGLWDSKAAA